MILFLQLLLMVLDDRAVDGFKLWYLGGSKYMNRVGILVDTKLREQVVKLSRSMTR